MTTISKFTNQRDEVAEIAAEMAWGQIKDWHMALDLRPAISAADCRKSADQVAFELIGSEFDDAAESVAVEVLRRLGFELARGDVNNGAIRKAT